MWNIKVDEHSTLTYGHKIRIHFYKKDNLAKYRNVVEWCKEQNKEKTRFLISYKDVPYNIDPFATVPLYALTYEDAILFKLVWG